MAVLAVFLLDSADLVHVMVIWAGANFVGGFLALGVAVRGLPTGPGGKVILRHTRR